LRLGSVLLGVSAVLLGWATVVEVFHGRKPTQFAIYGSWWFSAILVLLAVNVFCAAAIRFPWSRRQTGFVITHVGLLVLLTGCLLTRIDGVDSQIYLPEGRQSHRAYQESQRFALRVVPYASDAKDSGTGDAPANAPNPPSEARETREASGGEKIGVPFVAGPFNWCDYARLWWFPWRLAHRDCGLLYDADGIRLEVLDYTSDSDLAPAAPLKLAIDPASAADEGKPSAGAGWNLVELSPDPFGHMDRQSGDSERTNRHTFSDGRRIVYWSARDAGETNAFLHSAPEGPLGEKGQLVLWVVDRKFTFPVDGLEPGRRVPLGDSGLSLEMVGMRGELMAVDLRIHAPGDPSRPMTLMAEFPDFNRHDYTHGIYGAYWVDADAKWVRGFPRIADHRKMLAVGGARFDILQGADGKLHYRAWKSPRFDAVGPMPPLNRPMTAFAAGKPITLEVHAFEPADAAGHIVRPVSWKMQQEKERGRLQKQRRAKVRLTVDGNAEEFWIDGSNPAIGGDPAETNTVRSAAGKRRRVEVALEFDAFDLGFDVYLHRFDRRLDPGTSMASHFGSEVDFRQRPDDSDADESGDDAPPGNPRGASILTRVNVTLNEPIDFMDPTTGRSYRLFQESYQERMARHARADDAPDRTRQFVSILTVNYDPGRGAKYLGSLLIVVGVFITFRMRAYVFQRRPPADSQSK
jgi:hypothetical protein